MNTATASHEEFWGLHQRRQDAEWAALQPELEAFRATEEEQRMKAIEAAAFELVRADAMKLPESVGKIRVWGEELAQRGREGVRFERWRQMNGMRVS